MGWSTSGVTEGELPPTPGAQAPPPKMTAAGGRSRQPPASP